MSLHIIYYGEHISYTCNCHVCSARVCWTTLGVYLRPWPTPVNSGTSLMRGPRSSISSSSPWPVHDTLRQRGSLWISPVTGSTPTGRRGSMRDTCMRRWGWKHNTVEPLTNDHPHQRPSLSYDHISCDGQCFLFVYESLTSYHPSYTTTPMWFWGWSHKRGSTVLLFKWRDHMLSVWCTKGYILVCGLSD